MAGGASLSALVTDRVVDAGLPDPLLRAAIKALLWRRRRSISAGGVAARSERRRQLLAELGAGPITIAVEDANEQHYEVPTELFEIMLGPHLKYSSAWWPPGVSTLQQAEEAMLRLTCERAELRDGQDVLELGCGWGSLTLWMAERYPSSRIVAVSNSGTQADHIAKQAAVRGLDNVTVLTADVGRLGVDAATDVIADQRFDRVVSVEMFEHVRNHRALIRRIAGWLRSGGKLFVHVFAHHRDAYTLDTGARGDWMARHFFTGGIMPSDDLLLHAVSELELEDHWVVSGQHYARTLRAWLERLDAQREHVLALFSDAYGADRAEAWLHRWRTFTIACEELFACRGGNEWHVSHYRFAART